MDSGGGGSSTMKPASDGVPNQFPAGLRVLVVDDDPTCLKILEKMLRNCLYEVITCSQATVALTMLRERRYVFDLVISDVHMPDMDGFKLLEHIGLEMDLPVIMMSVDDKKEVVMKGVKHGACDYLIKPVRMEAIRNIWQHVVRKRRNELKEQSSSFEDNDRNRRPSEDIDYASSVNEGSWKSSKKRKDEEDDVDERDDTSTLKKPRVVWSVELHQQFVAAVNQLGIDKAVPKKILELMNVPGLTRENVASHLQKYRLYLRRISGGSPHQSGVNMPFMCSPEADFGSMSSFNGLDLQAFAVAGQLPPNSFATLQAGGLARSAVNNGIGIPHIDQRNPFSTEASKVRLGSGGNQPMNGNNKQADLYHGLPTSIEPKQLSHLHQSVPTSGHMGPQVSEGMMGFVNLPSLGTHSMNHNGTLNGNQSSALMMQMAQSGPKGSLNDISGGHSSGSSHPMGQQMFSDEITARVLGRNMPVLNGRATTYGPGSQSSSMLDFQMNHTFELPGNSFPVGIPTGVTGLQPKGMFQDRGSLEVKGPRGFATSYGIFNENPQSKNREWGLQNANVTYESSQHPKHLEGNIDFCPSVLAHHGVSYSQKGGMTGDDSSGNSLLLLREGNQLGGSEDLAQRGNNQIDSSFRIKAESVGDLSCDNTFIGKHFDQGDLMSAILKQQQGVGQLENEFNFDGYSLDDIPV